jgi:hypothetical protein
VVALVEVQFLGREEQVAVALVVLPIQEELRAHQIPAEVEVEVVILRHKQEAMEVRAS